MRRVSRVRSYCSGIASLPPFRQPATATEAAISTGGMRTAWRSAGSMFWIQSVNRENVCRCSRGSTTRTTVGLPWLVARVMHSCDFGTLAKAGVLEQTGCL